MERKDHTREELLLWAQFVLDRLDRGHRKA